MPRKVLRLLDGADEGSKPRKPKGVKQTGENVFKAQIMTVGLGRYPTMARAKEAYDKASAFLWVTVSNAIFYKLSSSLAHSPPASI